MACHPDGPQDVGVPVEGPAVRWPGREGSMNIDLEDKVAIVTGAGRGIGRCIATTLAAEKAVVIATDLRQDLLDDLAGEFATRGWRGRSHCSDVRVAADVEQVVAATVGAFGRIDILVNNAGVARGAP